MKVIEKLCIGIYDIMLVFSYNENFNAVSELWSHCMHTEYIK